MKVGGELFYCFSVAVVSAEIFMRYNPPVPNSVKHNHHQRTKQERQNVQQNKIRFHVLNIAGGTAPWELIRKKML